MAESICSYEHMFTYNLLEDIASWADYCVNTCSEHLDFHNVSS